MRLLKEKIEERRSKLIDVMKILAKAFVSMLTGEDLKKEVQKVTLISRFPAGTNAIGVITLRDRFEPRLDDLSESWDLDGDVFAKVRLINSETNLYEDQIAKVKLPCLKLPELNIPPYNARDIRSIKNLVSRYVSFKGARAYNFSSYGFEFLLTRECVNAFKDKILSFKVLETFTFKDKDYLVVSCDEINEMINQKVKELNAEISVLKSEFSEKKKIEESQFRQGVEVAGRILIDFDRVIKELNIVGLRSVEVEMDGAEIYTGVLKNHLEFLSVSVAEQIAKITKFKVESIDESSLRVVVSSSEIDTLLLSEKEAEAKTISNVAHDAGFEKKKISINEIFRSPLLIDGNNVVRHEETYGWRVLKTLLEWLNQNNRPFHVYFDATIEHLNIEPSGREFISAIIKELEYVTKCPAREEADKFILFNAEKSGSHILSNDCFRDREAQYPWVNSQNDPAGINRIHKFIVDTGHLVIPDLGIFKEIS